MKVKFETTSFGPGTLVRFRDSPLRRWTYGIYRGTCEHKGKTIGFEFSDLPLGPITRWLAYWPEFIEAAIPGKETR